MKRSIETGAFAIGVKGAAKPLTLTFNYDDPDARPYFTNVTVKSGLQVLTSAPEYLK